MHALYCNVLDHSHTRLEKLTPAFFRAILEKMPHQTYAMICFDGTHIAAFELFLESAHLHPLYIGMDYAYRDVGALYFNALYKIVEEAEEKGYPFVDMGQTSYNAKRGISAVTS